MAKFRTWLESQVRVGGVFKDGTIIFIVDGVRHVFERLDAAMFYNGKLAQLIKRNPAAAFDIVKELVERGDAVQVEPKQPKVQQSLFA